MSTPGDTMISVGDIMSTVGGVQYTRDTMSTLEGYHDECGGYHEYTGECSVHWGFHTNSNCFPNDPPRIYHDIPWCTEHPQCTHDIPQCTERLPMRCTLPVYCTDMPGVYFSKTESQ